MEKEKSIIDILSTLLKHRLFLLKYIFAITILALIVSLIWPKTYKSTVRFLPPASEKQSFSGIISSIIQTGPTTSKLSSEAMLVVLRSRDLKEKAIEKFDLANVYGIDIHEYVLLELSQKMLIEEIREGGFGFNPVVAIELSFIDKEPWRAKALGDFFIHHLDSIVQQLNYQRQYASYESIKNRYRRNIDDLRIAEDSLSLFQETYGVYEVESQLQEMVEKVSDIKKEIITLDVQIDVLNNTVSKNSPQLKKLREEKASLDSVYNSLLTDSPPYEYKELFKPLSLMPSLAKTYGRLYRNVQIQQKILEFIYPQYEQLKLQVESDPLGIQIVDKANLPTYKDKPKRLYIVLAGLIFGILSSLLVVYLKEYYNTEKQTQSEEFNKLQYIKNTLSFRNFFKA